MRVFEARQVLRRAREGGYFDDLLEDYSLTTSREDRARIRLNAAARAAGLFAGVPYVAERIVCSNGVEDVTGRPVFVLGVRRR